MHMGWRAALVTEKERQPKANDLPKLNMTVAVNSKRQLNKVAIGIKVG